MHVCFIVLGDFIFKSNERLKGLTTDPTQPDPKTPVLAAAQIDVVNLDEATQMSIATAKSIKDFEAQQAVKKFEEHLIDEDIEKIVKGDKE
ncbi:hypothetical protein Tco_0431501 [Tanacetum coccineum]